MVLVAGATTGGGEGCHSSQVRRCGAWHAHQGASEAADDPGLRWIYPVKIYGDALPLAALTGRIPGLMLDRTERSAQRL